MLMGILPVAIIGISAAFWAVVCAIKKTWIYLQQQFVTTLIVVLFLAHPNIVKSMFSVFAC